MIVEPMRRAALILLLLLSAPPAGRLAAQPGVSPERAAARDAFRRWKVGLFVHWGVYSALMDGEWVMNNRGITAAEYERIPPIFNPAAFNAAEWVALARAAGLRYITFTAKHHDGFAMWGTAATDWNIVARTPYGRDVVRQLGDACRADGMPLFLYYSQLDWHHPDYYPRGGTGRTAARPDSGSWGRYLDFMDAQLRELLTGYGPVAGVWLDGFWDKSADWQLDRTYGMIHALAPSALIASNHNGPPHPGEDLITFEKDLVPEHIPPGNDLPLEISEKINDTWGFRLWDTAYQSVDALVRGAVRAAGRDANYLINVGPMPDGRIQPEFVERLTGLGVWLRRFGESIYDTRGGPVPPRSWGVTTRHANTVYVHVLDWKDPLLSLPVLPGRVRAARRLSNGAPVPVAETAGGITLRLPPRDPGEADLIVAIELEERP
jgi:alpha-L-fucosidase